MRQEIKDTHDTLAKCHEEPFNNLQRSANSRIRVYLDKDFDTRKREAELQRLGFVIRRASPQDMSTIERLFVWRFGENWMSEIRSALQQQPPNAHLALVGSEIVAFAAHSTIHDEWGDFGPIGTAEEARGLGLGQILLYRCMTDLQAAGHKTAVIPWDGSDAFYERLLDCRFERVAR